jgi:hypothetical protein
MTDLHQQPPEILAALPRTRPQRRSSKRRPAQAGGQHAPEVFTDSGHRASPERDRQTGAGVNTAPGSRTGHPVARPSTESPSPAPPGLLRTLVQAGAELAEIGLSVSMRAVRDTVARLPRP